MRLSGLPLNEKGEFLNAAEGQEVLRIAAAEEFDYAEVDQLGSYRQDLRVISGLKRLKPVVKLVNK